MPRRPGGRGKGAGGTSPRPRHPSPPPPPQEATPTTESTSVQQPVPRRRANSTPACELRHALRGRGNPEELVAADAVSFNLSPTYARAVGALDQSGCLPACPLRIMFPCYTDNAAVAQWQANLEQLVAVCPLGTSASSSSDDAAAAENTKTEQQNALVRRADPWSTARVLFSGDEAPPPMYWKVQAEVLDSESPTRRAAAMLRHRQDALRIAAAAAAVSDYGGGKTPSSSGRSPEARKGETKREERGGSDDETGTSEAVARQLLTDGSAAGGGGGRRPLSPAALGADAITRSAGGSPMKLVPNAASGQPRRSPLASRTYAASSATTAASAGAPLMASDASAARFRLYREGRAAAVRQRQQLAQQQQQQQQRLGSPDDLTASGSGVSPAPHDVAGGRSPSLSPIDTSIATAPGASPAPPPGAGTRLSYSEQAERELLSHLQRQLTKAREEIDRAHDATATEKKRADAAEARCAESRSTIELLRGELQRARENERRTIEVVSKMEAEKTDLQEQLDVASRDYDRIREHLAKLHGSTAGGGSGVGGSGRANTRDLEAQLAETREVATEAMASSEKAWGQLQVAQAALAEERKASAEERESKEAAWEKYGALVKEVTMEKKKALKAKEEAQREHARLSAEVKVVRDQVQRERAAKEDARAALVAHQGQTLSIMGLLEEQVTRARMMAAAVLEDDERTRRGRISEHEAAVRTQLARLADVQRQSFDT